MASTFPGNKSYHTDKQASLELGFHDVVVGGRMTMAYIGHLLEINYGDRLGLPPESLT
ncbi:MAG: hypothetical protein CM1200mP9_09540 [Gammaproteobacteria bacterium]|nr:MAG: hypothetical protein CM1200mP9_09540 [Gammaproteobacteria bacterium]